MRQDNILNKRGVQVGAQSNTDLYGNVGSILLSINIIVVLLGCRRLTTLVSRSRAMDYSRCQNSTFIGSAAPTFIILTLLQTLYNGSKHFMRGFNRVIM